MRQVIKGKVYDTEAAERVSETYVPPQGERDKGLGYYDETLYRKRTGEYFLHGEVSSANPYASVAFAGVEKILPLTLEEARGWARDHPGSIDAEAVFGESGDHHLHIVLSGDVWHAVRMRSWETGQSVREVMEWCVRQALEGKKARPLG